MDEVIKSFVVSEPDVLGRTNMLKPIMEIGDAAPIVQRQSYVSGVRCLHTHRKRLANISTECCIAVIQGSSSPWCSPVVGVAVKKKNLPCLDSRKLNSVTNIESSALPFITRIIEKLKATRYLTALDLMIISINDLTQF